MIFCNNVGNGPQSHTVALSGETNKQEKFALHNVDKYISMCVKQFGISSDEFKIYSLILSSKNCQKDYHNPVNNVVLQPLEMAMPYSYITSSTGLSSKSAKKAIDNLVQYHYITIEMRDKTLKATNRSGDKFKKPVTVAKLTVKGDDISKYIGVKDVKKSDSAKDRAQRDHCSAEEYEDAKDYCMEKCNTSNIWIAVDYLFDEISKLKNRLSEVENRLSEKENEASEYKQNYYDLNNYILDLEEEE